MIFTILMLICVAMAVLDYNNRPRFWKWLAIGNAFTAINCFLTAQYGLCVIIALVAIVMVYLPKYIDKSLR